MRAFISNFFSKDNKVSTGVVTNDQEITKAANKIALDSFEESASSSRRSNSMRSRSASLAELSSRDGSNALRVLIRDGCPSDVLDEVMKSTEYINQENNEGKTAIFEASEQSLWDILGQLADMAGINVNKKYNGHSIITHALAYNTNENNKFPISLFNKLIQQGVEVSSKDLYYAAKNSNWEIVSALLNSHKENISDLVRNKKKETALMMLIANGADIALIQNILNLETNENIVNLSNVEGESAIFYAVKSRRVDAVELLLQQENIQYYHKNSQNKKPFEIAFDNGSRDIVDSMIEKTSGACVDDIMSEFIDVGNDIGFKKYLDIACREAIKLPISMHNVCSRAKISYLHEMIDAGILEMRTALSDKAPETPLLTAVAGARDNCSAERMEVISLLVRSGGFHMSDVDAMSKNVIDILLEIKDFQVQKNILSHLLEYPKEGWENGLENMTVQNSNNQEQWLNLKNEFQENRSEIKEEEVELDMFSITSTISTTSSEPLRAATPFNSQEKY